MESGRRRREEEEREREKEACEFPFDVLAKKVFFFPFIFRFFVLFFKTKRVLSLLLQRPAHPFL